MEPIDMIHGSMVIVKQYPDGSFFHIHKHGVYEANKDFIHDIHKASKDFIQDVRNAVNEHKESGLLFVVTVFNGMTTIVTSDKEECLANFHLGPRQATRSVNLN